MCAVYIEVGDSVYPSEEFCFSPSTFYPEYIFPVETIAKKENNIYDMVRNCLAGLEMDKENFGSSKWNPFKNLINKGDTVILKPNWVMHQNSNKNVSENALECLITHPSVVRAICDYCLIALKGTGKIIIGDAPMQGCDLEKLLKKANYNSVLSFYSKSKVDVLFCDFREYRSICDENKVIIDKEYTGQNSKVVELGNKSMHYLKNSSKKYQVSDYEEKITNGFHHAESHRYSINASVLEADVIINICKPKCHRLAGITGALKNIVGITYNKACLPHRTIGSKEEGGDEYLYKSYIKRLISVVLSKKTVYENSGRTKWAFLMRLIYGSLYYFVRIFGNDKNLIGSWYGNDTIWRTVIDLNYILNYATKCGEISDCVQRKTFHFADMIISGQGNGPVSPEPKELGIIIASESAVVLDRIICNIMGFDYEKVPGLVNTSVAGNFNFNNIEDYCVRSNITEYCGTLKSVVFPKEMYFRPHDSWKGHIEKQ